MNNKNLVELAYSKDLSIGIGCNGWIATLTYPLILFISFFVATLVYPIYVPYWIYKRNSQNVQEASP